MDSLGINAATPTTNRPATEIEVRKDAAADGAKPERSFWQRAFGDDGLTFSTLLDVINPLQHIPVVSTIYREITGDKIAPGAKLIGDTLFGGPIGLALSAVDVTIQGETGKDVGQHVFAMLKPSTPAADSAIATADGKTGSLDPMTAVAIAEPAGANADNAAPVTKAAEFGAVPQKPAAPAVDPAAYAPRSALVAAAMKPRAPGNGVGGVFVPLETRSTIAPSAMFAPVSLAVAAPHDDLAKPAETGTALPDAKAVAGNPSMLQSLRANGTRPPPATRSVNVPMPPALPPLPPLAAATDATGATDAVGDVMARNLERYMALRNRRPAPSKVDRAF